MVALDWDVDRTDGVTLVRLYVTADDTRRVRIETRLDGPVWPPRRQGQPAAGWDGDAFEGIVTPDDRLVTGFSTPAPPEDPPATVVSDSPAEPSATTGPVAATGGDGWTTVGAGDTRPTAPDGGGRPLDGNSETGGDIGQSPAAVVRSFGDPIVPRDAVPVPETSATRVRESAVRSRDGESSQSTASPTAASPAGGQKRTDPDDGTDPADGTHPRSREEASAEPRSHRSQRDPPTVDAALAIPGPVRTWLRDVKRRLDAVECRGSRPPLDGPLADTVAVDRRALEHVAAQVETFSERAGHLAGGSTGDQPASERP